MNCCNDYGNCDQGRDCPVRKKRAQDTYKDFYEMNLKVPDPYVETIGSVKELFFVVFVTAAFTLLAFLIWGK